MSVARTAFFPLLAKTEADGSMTLRDVFAGQAMQASFAGSGAQQLADRDGRYDETNWAEIVALNAYEMADAMLAERKRSATS